MGKVTKRLQVLDPRGQPSGIYGRGLDPDTMPWAIHDPVNQPRASVAEFANLQMAPRLDSLEGKTVYLVSTGFAGSLEFMEELQDWFRRNMPGVKTVLRNKKTSMFTDEPELWAEIKANGDAAILGVGG
ncbi:MAG: hypothetical protein N2506_01140 [Dehalococcoidales bacterium]|nr:hypothetical protein [Dehalococcoidales bacterium]